MNEVFGISKGEMNGIPRLGVFPRGCKGSISVDSKASHLSIPRVWVKQSEGLCSVEVLKKMSQLHLQEFNVLGQDLRSG